MSHISEEIEHEVFDFIDQYGSEQGPDFEINGKTKCRMRHEIKEAFPDLNLIQAATLINKYSYMYGPRIRAEQEAARESNVNESKNKSDDDESRNHSDDESEHDESEHDESQNSTDDDLTKAFNLIREKIRKQQRIIEENAQLKARIKELESENDALKTKYDNLITTLKNIANN